MKVPNSKTYILARQNMEKLAPPVCGDILAASGCASELVSIKDERDASLQLDTQT